jgi:hypothetical protein
MILSIPAPSTPLKLIGNSVNKPKKNVKTFKK